MEPSPVAMTQQETVDVISLQHLFYNAFVESEIKEITKIKWILQMDDIGPETAFYGFQELFGEGWEVKAIVCACVSCNHCMPTRSGYDS